MGTDSFTCKALTVFIPLIVIDKSRGFENVWFPSEAERSSIRAHLLLHISLQPSLHVSLAWGVAEQYGVRFRTSSGKRQTNV